MSDITISVVQPPSTTINVGVDETLIVGAGISFPSHSVTHISGGSDELNHNLLGGLQGGSVNQYYHISSGQYFNLTTGDVVRPSETGIFYTNNNPSGFITGVDLSSYVLNSETGNFITNSQTGAFYSNSNPSGFITGVDLSSYVLNTETGNFITTSQTGQFYSSHNPSGYITGVDLSFSGNYYTKDESESRYVNINGSETILGNKTFHDNVYINNLYVTGLETIVNTTNTNISSNFIMLNLTGGAVDGGIFFVTGSGLTGINDSGAIIGFDHSDKFKFGIGTRGEDLSVLNTIASEQQLNGISGYLQTQITTLNDQTSDYVLNTETGNFITTSQTGQFYSNDNPSGFITGIDLSAYVLDSETGSFITNSQTGEFYPNSNPSGYITGISDIVYITGDQTITGQKRFLDSLILQSDSNQLRLRTGQGGHTIFITTPAIFGDRTYTIPDVGHSCAFVMNNGPQIINGAKDFTIRPTFSGTDVALVSEFADLVYTSGDQIIGGIKTFNNNIIGNGNSNLFINESGFSPHSLLTQQQLMLGGHKFRQLVFVASRVQAQTQNFNTNASQYQTLGMVASVAALTGHAAGAYTLDGLFCANTSSATIPINNEIDAFFHGVAMQFLPEATWKARINFGVSSNMRNISFTAGGLNQDRNWGIEFYYNASNFWGRLYYAFGNSASLYGAPFILPIYKNASHTAWEGFVYSIRMRQVPIGNNRLTLEFYINDSTSNVGGSALSKNSPLSTLTTVSIPSADYRFNGKHINFEVVSSPTVAPSTIVRLQCTNMYCQFK